MNGTRSEAKANHLYGPKPRPLGRGLVYYLIDRRRNKTIGKLKTFYGETKIVFGSNAVLGCPNILMINNKPIFSAVIKRGAIFRNKRRLLVSIIIFDRNNNVVAQIEKNRWVLNKNNFFKKEIKKDNIKVINQQGEIALECKALKDRYVVVNGTFYVTGTKIHATDKGLQIN